MLIIKVKGKADSLTLRVVVKKKKLQNAANENFGNI